jgi:hypothetical protein
MFNNTFDDEIGLKLYKKTCEAYDITLKKGQIQTLKNSQKIT